MMEPRTSLLLPQSSLTSLFSRLGSTRDRVPKGEYRRLVGLDAVKHVNCCSSPDNHHRPCESHADLLKAPPSGCLGLRASVR